MEALGTLLIPISLVYIYFYRISSRNLLWLFYCHIDPGVPGGTQHHNITMTSQWPRWRQKSPASRLFIQSFIQAQIKENIKAPRHWPLCGEFTGTGEFPAQRASNAENVSILWRQLDLLDCLLIWVYRAMVTHVYEFLMRFYGLQHLNFQLVAVYSFIQACCRNP